MTDAVKPRQPPRGRFITFEGGEGSGKSTQIQLLADRLNAAKLRTITTREPGGSAGAEIVRHLLLSGMAKAFGPETESLLFAAARDDHVSQVIEPALAQGLWVLCDRFTDSTRVYQGELGQGRSNTDPGDGARHHRQSQTRSHDYSRRSGCGRDGARAQAARDCGA